MLAHQCILSGTMAPCSCSVGHVISFLQPAPLQEQQSVLDRPVRELTVTITGDLRAKGERPGPHLEDAGRALLKAAMSQ